MQKKNINQFIYASSSCVYDIKPNKEKYSEIDSVIGNSFYATSKITSENYIKCYSKYYNFKYTILRYFNIYGPGQDLNIGILNAFISQFLNKSIKNIEVKGSLDRFRDFIYIDDVLNITNASILNEMCLNKVINVGSGTKTSIHSILKEIKNILGSSKQWFESNSTKGNQFGLYADKSLLNTFYEAKLNSFEIGLKKYLNFLIK